MPADADLTSAAAGSELMRDTLECAFCCGPISSHATACRHCGRDVTIPLPLMRRLADQMDANRALKAENDDLRAQLAQAKSALPSSPASVSSSRQLTAILACALVSFVLLLSSHYLIVIRFDLNTIFLRLASVALPVLVAAAIPGGWRAPIWLHVIVGIVLGLASVAAMSGAVALVDRVSWLPTTQRDAFEAAEYALSIALAHVAGVLVARAFAGFLERRDRRLFQARGAAESVDKAFQGALKLHGMWEAAAPLLATAAALWAGLRAVVGGP